MRIAVRRRVAAGGALLSSALVGGLLVTAGPASAAVTADKSPANTESTQIVFTTDGPVDVGSTVTFDGPAAGDTFTARVDSNDTSRQRPRVTVNLAAPAYTDTSAGGPANPGPYTVSFQQSTVPTSSPPGTCTGCLTVLALPPTATSVSPTGVRQGLSGQVTLTGSGFARDTSLVVLNRDGKVPTADNAEVRVTRPGATDTPNGTDATTTTSLRRILAVAPGAPLGPRTLRLTNTDGRTTDCVGCFNVLGAPLTGVSPQASLNTPNEGAVEITFTAPAGTFGADAVARLVYVASGTGSSDAQRLSLQGSRTSLTTGTAGTSEDVLKAVFDLRAAAPGQDAYQPTVISTSGGTNTSSTLFDVTQPEAPTVSGTAPAGQQAGTAQRVSISGTFFAKGATVQLVGQGQPPVTGAPEPITGTDVEFVSSTTLRATFTVPSGASLETRDVRVTNTNGLSGTRADSYAITAAASPSPTATATQAPSPTPTATRSATPTATATPTRSATPTATSASPTPARVTPRITLPRSTITSQQSAIVDVTGQPGAVVELHAYSRPSTTYRIARKSVIAADGTIRFEVGPSGNTRMFVRTYDVGGANQVDSASVVLTVRTSLNLKVARLGTGTYRFTGSTLPKRRGQLVTVFYQADGANRVIAARARVAQDGTYNVTRRFTGTGTFTLFTGTGTDINNAGNESNRVRTTIR